MAFLKQSTVEHLRKCESALTKVFGDTLAEMSADEIVAAIEAKTEADAFALLASECGIEYDADAGEAIKAALDEGAQASEKLDKIRSELSGVGIDAEAVKESFGKVVAKESAKAVSAAGLDTTDAPEISDAEADASIASSEPKTLHEAIKAAASAKTEEEREKFMKLAQGFLTRK